MITAKISKQSFAVGGMPLLLCAQSYAQSAITTSQRVHVATFEILLRIAKHNEIWGLKMASEVIS